MSSTPNPAPEGDHPDTTGSTLPPYEGRRESADLDGREESERDGAKVGGATGPVVDAEMKAPEPGDTESGAVASPADEQAAVKSTDTDLDDDGVGPSHTPGTPRAEDSGA